MAIYVHQLMEAPSSIGKVEGPDITFDIVDSYGTPLKLTCTVILDFSWKYNLESIEYDLGPLFTTEPVFQTPIPEDSNEYENGIINNDFKLGFTGGTSSEISIWKLNGTLPGGLNYNVNVAPAMDGIVNIVLAYPHYIKITKQGQDYYFGPYTQDSGNAPKIIGNFKLINK